MLGVVCALEIEEEELLSAMIGKSKKIILGYEFVTGILEDKPLVVALSGVGKVNAASVTSIMLSHFSVTEIINVGICGSIYKVGTTIVATSVVQHDFDLTAFGMPLGVLDGFETPFLKCSERMIKRLCSDVQGVIASGDRFIGTKEDANKLVEVFGAVGFDMESGAIAQVCTHCGVDFAVVRIVSDGGDASEYEKLKSFAASKDLALICGYLKD